MKDFSKKIVSWHQKSGRKNLPWQTKNPYHVWISEIMLQQTQVVKVIEYFKRFIEHFPTQNDLAKAQEQQVLSLWSGLGYYNRARNLHKTAQICEEQHKGKIPKNLEALMALPGIGRSTAGAIMSLAYDQPQPIMDGNAKRVFSRFYLLGGEPNKPSVLKLLWQKAEQHISLESPANYNQALMDIGATVCTKSKPHCPLCPIQENCQARIKGVIGDYPGKKKKVIKQELHMHVALITNGAEFQLELRDKKSIWPRLWFLPTYNSVTEIRQSFGIKTKAAFTIKHILSHRELFIHVYCIKAIVDLNPKYHTVDQDKLIEYPHPKALLKILNAHKKL